MTAAAGSAPIDSTPAGSTPIDPTPIDPTPVVPVPVRSTSVDPMAAAVAEPSRNAESGSAGQVGVAQLPATEAAPEHRPGPVDWLLVVAITILSGWAAVIGLAFLPLYVGGVPLPVSALLGVAAMILAPRTCYRLTGSMLAALLPVVAWFGVSVWVVLSYNRLLPTVPLTVIAGQWRVMVMLGLGALAAAATVGLIWGDRLKERVEAQSEQGERSVSEGNRSGSPA